MCFSAAASFSSGVILGSIGVISVRKVTEKRLLPLALIPVFFAIQQFSEGFVWLAATDRIPESWQMPSTVLFLVFAQSIWTTWVPLAFFLPEKNTQRRKSLAVILALAAVVSCYHLYCLLNYPVTSSLAHWHIKYNLQFPGQLAPASAFLYVAATLLPPFISSLPRVKMVAFANLFSFLFTALFFREHLISVWCFFAAIISLLLLPVLEAVRHKQPVLQS